MTKNQKIEILEQENAALRQSRAKYEQLLENLNEVFYTLNPDGFVTYVSPNVERLGGYRPEEIIGRRFTDFVYPEDLPERFGKFPEILSGRDIITEYRFVTKGGTAKWIRTNGRPISRNGEITGIQGMLVDIDNPKQMEEQLRRNERKFRVIFNSTSDAVYIHDMAGRILEANAVACNETGYSYEELLQMTPMDIVVPSEQHMVPKRLQELRQKGQLIFETTHRRKDGTQYPVEIKHRIIEYEGKSCVLGVVRDLTERKQKEEALRESERQKNLILNSATEKIIYFSTDMRVIWANRAAASLTGEAEEAITGRCCYELCHKRSAPCPDCLVEKARDTQTPQEAEKQGPGDRYWLMRAYPAIGNGGKVAGIVLFIQDITEKQRAEEEKKKLEAQFQQSQKMESIGRLAGGVAHDLNNLLSPILGYGEMILAEKQEDEALQRRLTHIIEAGSRACSIVRQLLAFSRKQMLEFQPVDINKLLRDLRSLLRHSLREDIALRMDLSDPLPIVNSDAGQIEQVVMNLAVNAQDAMPEGGELSIQTAAVDLDEGYARPKKGVTPGYYVKMSVSDTGCGMDAHTLANLFEPFYTTKEKDKGTGLGLSTAYGIVKQHGGNIWAYSEPGMGTTIKVYLPVSSREYAAEKKEPNAETAPLPKRHGSETILLVEDEQTVRELVVSILEAHGYRVFSAPNGREARSLLARQEQTVHLLLTDVILPDINGKELYEQIAEACPRIGVLFMSGYTEDIIAYHGILEPGVNFIQKPFSVADIAAKVREVLTKR
ncbi:MAG TPA: PAS domain S-box protein [Desulfosalsimonadaceae bacterium]|nr:PAS domain S-box protein [Desulfosalsimonadaceae bacterium]